jgi:hypothetical protein
MRHWLLRGLDAGRCWMRPTRDRRLWFARAVFCVLGVLLLSIPAQALADGVVPGGVGDVIDDVTEGSGDAVDEVVGEVDDVVEPVTEGVGDVVEPVTEEAGEVAGSVTEGAGDAVDDATEIVDEVVDDVSGAVDDVAGSASDAAGTVGGAADGVIGSSDQTVASSPTAPSDGHGGGGGGGTEPTSSGPAVGSSGSASPTGGARWMHREVDRPYFRWDFSGDVLGLRVPSAQVVEGGSGPNEDPCDADVQLVCLGLLYGLGEFADTPAQVLGFLATTGIGVIALVKLAVGLGIAGSTALVGSRRYGAAATVGRTG